MFVCVYVHTCMHTDEASLAAENIISFILGRVVYEMVRLNWCIFSERMRNGGIRNPFKSIYIYAKKIDGKLK